jgi:phosphatidylinositol 4-kinase
MRLQYAEAQQIRDRIMKEMMALEEERMERMKEDRFNSSTWSSRNTGGNGAGLGIRDVDVGNGSTTGAGGENSAEDEGIIRRELNKDDPSAVVFSESWAAKKVRASFTCFSPSLVC